jgi:hypothetical protein
MSAPAIHLALRLPAVSGLPPDVIAIGFRPARLRPEMVAQESVRGSLRTSRALNAAWLAGEQGEFML